MTLIIMISPNEKKNPSFRFSVLPNAFQHLMIWDLIILQDKFQVTVNQNYNIRSVDNNQLYIPRQICIMVRKYG
jgi:hypothetical protein